MDSGSMEPATAPAGDPLPSSPQQQPEPDVMNDPAFTPPQVTARAQEELDTCRICRGDGSPEEPLFHPCKCSGSIKHVHQECLMEWLSHSQKKYCELCKTPFRFTKLYHPHMPSSLPNIVFLRRAAVHVLNALFNWCRGILVISIWSVWLPWSMRYAWSGLFWIGDGRWNQDLPSITERLNAEHQLRLSSLNATATQGSTPAPRVVQMPGLKELFGLVGMLAFGNSDSAGSTLSNSTSLNATGGHSPFAGRNSILSDWELLHDLTPEPWLNKLVLDTMEGQIITLSVVVGFILIFLIREWVVQQQPALNFGAFQEEAENANEGRAGAGEPAAEAAPVVQDQPLPTAAPQASESAPRGTAGTDAGDFFADSDLEPLEPSSEIIDQLIRDLQTSSGTLRWMVEPDSENFQGTQADLQAARDVMVKTRRLCSTVKRQSKLALDSRKTADARIALDYLSRLQEALTYFPWKDENELASIMNDLQAYISTAYELITMLEDNAQEQAQSADDLPLAAESRSIDPDIPANDLAGSLMDAPEGQSTDLPTCEPLLDVSRLNDESGEVQQPSRSDVRGAEHASPGTQRSAEVSSSAPEEQEPSETHGDSPTRGSVGSDDWSLIDILKQPEEGDQANDPAAGTSSSLVEGDAKSEDIFKDHSATDVASAAHALDRTNGSGSIDIGHEITQAKELPNVDQAARADQAAIPSASPSLTTSEVPSMVAPSAAHPEEPRTKTNRTSPQIEPRFSPPIPDNEHSLPEGLPVDTEAQPHEMIVPSDQSENPQAHQVQDRAPMAVQDEPGHRAAPPPAPGWLESLLDCIFGDLVPPGPPADRQGNEEHIVQDLAAEAPFVPFNDNRPDLNGGQGRAQLEAARPAANNAALVAGPALEVNPVPDVIAAEAANVAQDAEAIEEAEDIEGILELIGMQGPISGLFQNAVFAAVLVTATIALSILLPYVCGKLVVIILADPVRALNIPLQLISGISNFLIDVGIVAGGAFLALVDYMGSIAMLPLTFIVPGFSKVIDTVSIGKACSKAADAALSRMVDGILTGTEAHAQGQSTLISALPALRVVQAQVHDYYALLEEGLLDGYQKTHDLDLSSWRATTAHFLRIASLVWSHLQAETRLVGRIISGIPAVFRSGKLVLNLGHQPSDLLALQEEAWTISDRVTIVLAGYASFAFAGALYVQRRTPFSTSEHGRRTEQIIREVFLQAAGVLKVILIIGIEMLVFPLYCGFLLDTAMLPLFPDATIASRMSFTKASVCSSFFFHWFVGTCYMFHFALYISMCRKIFRRGVLYFIRDPDDPTFHPVRDVLERSVSSQLRKIGFSALVYGGLVILCMGSVVWAVAYGVSGVLPLRWIRASYLGYPIDFILYNLLAPMAVHLLRPSKGIQTIYEWWFKKTARALRLSLFLFNEPDNLGNGSSGEGPNERDDGRYVRAPASDSVRLPRGRSAFLEVDDQNNRLDRQQEPEDSEEAHARTNEQYAKVWIPPYFKLRIGVFVFMMWVLTAVLGLSTTVAPLMLGRWALARFLDESPNDLYAYVIGLCPFVFAYYAKAAAARSWKYVKTHVTVDASTFASLSNVVQSAILRAAKIVYTYFIFAIVAPTLLALILECYFIIPLHSYSKLQDRPVATHAIRYLQDWTMGMMYLRVVVRTMTLYSETRAARGLQAVIARGYFDPDVRIATRCFIVPFVAIAGTFLGLPIAFSQLSGWLLKLLVVSDAFKDTAMNIDAAQVDELQVHMNRLSYPLVLASGLGVWVAYLVKHAARRWRLRIRDEIYLIGERLHNFGEARPDQIPAAG